MIVCRASHAKAMTKNVVDFAVALQNRMTVMIVVSINKTELVIDKNSIVFILIQSNDGRKRFTLVK